MEYEKLMTVLNTDSEDGLMELAAERIKELGSENSGKQKVIDKLEKNLAYAKEKQKLLEEKQELKKQIAQEKAKCTELDKKEAALRQTLQGLQSHKRKILQADSSDSEIGKLKLARMNIYQSAHGLTEDNNPKLLGGRSVVVDSNPWRKRLCSDGADEVIDRLKRK